MTRRTVMKRSVAATLFGAACSMHGDTVTGGGLHEVLVMPAIPNHDLDVLFMIDDSPSMLDKQESLRASFPTMMDQLARVPDGLPNLHVGVSTSDMCTSALDGSVGPAIPGSVGGCVNAGKGGALQTFQATTVTGLYLSDTATATGRDRNYTGELRDAFSAMSNAGAAGCGFEQPLAAIHAALAPSNTATAGFLRDAAYLADVQTLAEGLQGLKADPSLVMVAAIVGDPSPFEIELRAPLGSATPIPALAHSCQYAGNEGPTEADPAVR